MGVGRKKGLQDLSNMRGQGIRERMLDSESMPIIAAIDWILASFKAEGTKESAL
jgi:hypothetical protein